MQQPLEPRVPIEPRGQRIVLGEPNRRKPPLSRVGEILLGWFGSLKHHSPADQKGRSESDLDEFGLPREWRRPEPMYLADNRQGWSAFSTWAQQRGVRAFPASVATVVRFIAECPRPTSDLHQIWEAIDLEHTAHYWHTDANPIMILRMAGIDIDETGTIVEYDWPPGGQQKESGQT